MHRFVVILVLALIGQTAAASARGFQIGSADFALEVPPGFCIIDETTSEARDWFARAYAAQQAAGNTLKQAILRCDEIAKVKGPEFQQLSEWSLVYVNDRNAIAPQGFTHATFSEEFCKQMPGYLAERGSELDQFVDRIGRSFFNMPLKSQVGASSMVKDSCITPLRLQAGVEVFGFFTPVIVKGASFFLSTYSIDKTDLPRIAKQMVAWSEGLRSAP